MDSSREQGAGSREQGVGSREQGARSREQGARSREHHGQEQRARAGVEVMRGNGGGEEASSALPGRELWLHYILYTVFSKHYTYYN